jgi:SAM-dependent methyltransferase
MQEGAVLESEPPVTTAGEQDRLLALPSDHYSRYALTREIFASLRSALGTRARVLDVGGHSSPLAYFLPDDEVVLVDVEPVGTVTALPLKCDDYVRGSGAALPFRDSSFDVVSAHDTLEHIPPDLRGPFLGELARTGRRLLILTGPVWQDEVAAAEARIDRFVREITGSEHQFLAEHVELGLPKPADIERFLEQQSLEYCRIPAGDVRHWQWELAIDQYLAALPSSDGLRAAINRARNIASPPGDLTDGVSYRTAYVVALDREVAGLLPQVQKRVAEIRNSASGRQDDEALLLALQEHGAAVRVEIARLHEALYAAEKRGYELQDTHDRIARSLGDREAEVREIADVLATRDAELLERREELESIKATRWYRLSRSNWYQKLESQAERLSRRRKR